MHNETTMKLLDELNKLLDKHLPVAYTLETLTDIYRLDNFLDNSSPDAFIPEFYVAVKQLTHAIKDEFKKTTDTATRIETLRTTQAETPLQILLFKANSDENVNPIIANSLPTVTQRLFAFSKTKEEKMLENIIPLKDTTDEEDYDYKGSQIIDGKLYMDSVEFTPEILFSSVDEEDIPLFRTPYDDDAYEILTDLLSKLDEKTLKYLIAQQYTFLTHQDVERADNLSTLSPGDYLVRHDKTENDYSIAQIKSVNSDGLYFLDNKILLPHFVELSYEFKVEDSITKVSIHLNSEVEYLPYTTELGLAILNSSVINASVAELEYTLQMLDTLKQRDLTKVELDFNPLLDGIEYTYDIFSENDLFTPHENLVTHLSTCSEEEYEAYKNGLTQKLGEELALALLSKVSRPAPDIALPFPITDKTIVNSSEETPKNEEDKIQNDE